MFNFCSTSGYGQGLLDKDKANEDNDNDNEDKDKDSLNMFKDSKQWSLVCQFFIFVF